MRGFLSGVAGVVATLISTGTLSAQEYGYISHGHRYALKCNQHGYELTSKYPVFRFSDSSAQPKKFDGIERIYLGRKCDAVHSLFGGGKWCQANGGFKIEFSDFEFGFPRQGLTCDKAALQIDGCDC